MFGFLRKGKHDKKLNRVEMKHFESFDNNEVNNNEYVNEDTQVKFDAEFDNVNLRVFGLVDDNTLKLIFNGKELIVELLGFTRDNYLVLKNKSDNELLSSDKIKIFYEGDIQYIMLPLNSKDSITQLNIRVNNTVFKFKYHLDMSSIQQIDLVSVIKAVTDNITLIA